MRLITFNLASSEPNDIEAVNPEHVVSIRRTGENTTQIFTSDGNNIMVASNFHGVKTLLENARELK